MPVGNGPIYPVAEILLQVLIVLLIFYLVFKGSVQRGSRSGVTSALGTLYGDVVMGILLSLVEAAILYEAFNISPL